MGHASASEAEFGAICNREIGSVTLAGQTKKGGDVGESSMVGGHRGRASAHPEAVGDEPIELHSEVP